LNEIRMFFRATRPIVSLNQFPNFEFADQTPSPFCTVRAGGERGTIASRHGETHETGSDSRTTGGPQRSEHSRSCPRIGNH
jgi:hypothetical protein